MRACRNIMGHNHTSSFHLRLNLNSWSKAAICLVPNPDWLLLIFAYSGKSWTKPMSGLTTRNKWVWAANVRTALFSTHLLWNFKLHVASFVTKIFPPHIITTKLPQMKLCMNLLNGRQKSGIFTTVNIKKFLKAVKTSNQLCVTQHLFECMPTRLVHHSLCFEGACVYTSSAGKFAPCSTCPCCANEALNNASKKTCVTFWLHAIQK